MDMKYLLTPAAQVALIIGLVEVTKRLEIIPNKYLPVLDLVLGVISGVIVYGIHLNYGYVNGICLGIAMGLSACGLFSGIKNVTSNV
jgi:hypothetical protein